MKVVLNMAATSKLHMVKIMFKIHVTSLYSILLYVLKWFDSF